MTPQEKSTFEQIVEQEYGAEEKDAVRITSVPTPYESFVNQHDYLFDFPSDPAKKQVVAEMATNFDNQFGEDRETLSTFNALFSTMVYARNQATAEKQNEPEPTFLPVRVPSYIEAPDLLRIIETFPNPGDLITATNSHYHVPEGGWSHLDQMLESLYGERYVTYKELASEREAPDIIEQSGSENLESKILGSDEIIEITDYQHIDSETIEAFQEASGMPSGELKGVINVGSDTENLSFAIVDVTKSPMTHNGWDIFGEGDDAQKWSSADIILVGLDNKPEEGKKTSFYGLKRGGSIVIGRNDPLFSAFAERAGLDKKAMETISREHCRISLDETGKKITIQNLHPSNRTVLETSLQS